MRCTPAAGTCSPGRSEGAHDRVVRSLAVPESNLPPEGGSDKRPRASLRLPKYDRSRSGKSNQRAAVFVDFGWARVGREYRILGREYDAPRRADVIVSVDRGGKVYLAPAAKACDDPEHFVLTVGSSHPERVVVEYHGLASCV